MPTIFADNREGNLPTKALDEMVVSIKGKKYWLWRAVDANGYVLDALLQIRRTKKAAVRLMRKLLKSQGLMIALACPHQLVRFDC